MTNISVTRTSDHTISVADLASAPGDSGLCLPTWLANSSKVEIGTLASPLYVGPGTSTTWAISAASLPLPSGAATSAKQDTIIGHVDGIETLLTTIDTDTGGIATSAASIDAKIPALGQALAAGSVPVVLTASQLSTLTPLSTVAATQSGTWTIQPGNTANTTAWLVTGTGGTFPATQSGTWTVGLSASQTLATVTTVGTVATLSGGGVAHDGIDSGNPVKIGGKAVSTQSGQTAVASADRSDLIQDLDGTVIERPHTHGDMVSGAASTTGTSDTSAVAAQGASTYFYCTGWSIANTGSTATLITFKDGSGGTALGYTVAPASGGSNYSAGGKPLFRTSANTALYFACGSASTTVYVTVYGYKSKV